MVQLPFPVSCPPHPPLPAQENQLLINARWHLHPVVSLCRDDSDPDHINPAAGTERAQSRSPPRRPEASFIARSAVHTKAAALTGSLHQL